MKSHKKKWKNNGNPRYRLNTEEEQIIIDYRRLKQEAKAEGLNPNDILTILKKNPRVNLSDKKAQTLGHLSYLPNCLQIILEAFLVSTLTL